MSNGKTKSDRRTSPFGFFGWLVRLLLSMMRGVLRQVGKPGGADLVRASDTHEIADETTSAAARTRSATQATLDLVDKQDRERARHERLVARRQSLRRQPTEHMATMLGWMDAAMEGRSPPDLSTLPDDLRRTLDRMLADPSEIQAMRQSLAVALGVDARPSGAEKDIKARMAERAAAIRARRE